MNDQKKNPGLAAGVQGTTFRKESTPTLPQTIPANIGLQIAQQTGYGAAPGDWQNCVDLGLTHDLLTVVSNPMAVISPDSKLESLGKTPSKFDSKGEVTGIYQWTKRITTAADVAEYSQQPDYGICLQTREVRAIDADVSDLDMALDIEGLITAHLGFPLPVRRRQNSSKFLMLFRLHGDLTKRRFKVNTSGDFVELLATGQQAIIYGTHTSGTRYEWDGGAIGDIPELTAEQFESLWAALHARFGSEDSVTLRQGRAPTVKRRAADINDPKVAYMVKYMNVFDITDEGRVDYECEFSDSHSMDSGPTACSYYPAGVGDIPVGRTKCMHASCAGRIERDRDEKNGWMAYGFEVIEIPQADANLPAVLPPPDFAFSHTGKVKSTLDNVVAALFRPDICGYQLRFDNFHHAVLLSKPGVDEWRPMKDTDYTAMRLRLAKPGLGHFGFEEIGRENIRDAVGYVASETTFDAAIFWIESLKWDGVSRIAKFLPDYFGTTDTPYHRAIGLYVWTALAGRVMVPGIKADMLPVAVGEQGAMKSSTVAAIVPNKDYFVTADLAKKDDDLARLMRGKLVVELAELVGLGAKRVEHVKAFITRTREEWTPKYFEFNTCFERRCIFFGTTNKRDFLTDTTGNRRWLPFNAGVCNPVGVAEVRDQLWAEALVLFQRDGILWEEAETLGKLVHENYVEHDAWEEPVIAYLTGADGMEGPAPMDEPFTAVMVLRNALSIPPARIGKSEKDRMAGLLANLADKLKLEKCKPYIDGMQQRGYVRRKQ